ncbi:MAG: hypothetical protein N3F62_08300 [Bacteroidia bacterium]|nr:hypothetical protein [Bacteroidia bacterium]
MRRAAANEVSRRHCLAFVSPRCEGIARSNLLLVVWQILLRLLHFVRNDDKARVAEAKAKPVAARPEHITAE